MILIELRKIRKKFEGEVNLTTAKVKLDTWHKNCVVVSAGQGEVNARFL